MRDGRPCCAGCHGTAWGVVAVGVCDIGNWLALAGVALRNGLAVLVVLNAAVAAAGAAAADVPADVDAPAVARAMGLKDATAEKYVLALREGERGGVARMRALVGEKGKRVTSSATEWLKMFGTLRAVGVVPPMNINSDATVQ